MQPNKLSGMPLNQIYASLKQRKAQGQKSFAVLIDPDNVHIDELEKFIQSCNKSKVDYILVGGSLVVSNQLDEVVAAIKSFTKIPIILFPGSPSQITNLADALLYLSLISGRNPELLIGQHVISAPAVKKSGLEVIPTGYMVIDGGAPTTVSYISNAAPIPSDKKEIAQCTAMAGEMLGMQLIYMDAGSGAKTPISENMIRSVAAAIEVPLIIGGGIRTPEWAHQSAKAGADLIVVGNALEKDPGIIEAICNAVHQAGNP